MLSAADIRWTLAPIPAPHPLAMSDQDWVTEVHQDAMAYRELALAAMAAQHDGQRDHTRQREQHQQLVLEYRAFRERVLMGDR